MWKYISLLFFVLTACTLLEDRDSMMEVKPIYEGDELKLAQYRVQLYDTSGIANGSIEQHFFTYDEQFNLTRIRKDGGFGVENQLDFIYKDEQLAEIQVIRLVNSINDEYFYDTLFVHDNRWASKEDMLDNEYLSVMIEDNRIIQVDSVIQGEILPLRSLVYDAAGNIIDVENTNFTVIIFDYDESVLNPFKALSPLSAFSWRFFRDFPIGDIASSENLPKYWKYGNINRGILAWTLDEKARPVELTWKATELSYNTYKINLEYIN